MQIEKVAIIIPALNEEEALRHMLPEIPPHIADWIIVVDNDSNDHTADVARKAGAIVVSEPVRGYGRACYTGLQTALRLGAHIITFMDGDGSDDPADLPLMLPLITKGKTDLVIGSRVSARAERGAVPVQARLGNWLVSRLVTILYRMPLHDIGSFRIIRGEALQRLQMREMTFGWPVEMLVKAAKARYRISEFPLHYRKRSHGHSKVAGTFAGSVKAAYFMLSVTFRYIFVRGDNA